MDFRAPSSPPRSPPAPEPVEREDVRFRQIDDVDVVADAGPILRRIVGAEHLQRRPVRLRSRQGEGNQVRLRGVVLAPLGARPRGIEVAQRRVADPVYPAIPLEDLFAHPLALAVRVRRERSVRPLRNRRRLRVAVGRRGGGEKDPPATGLDACIEQRFMIPPTLFRK